MSRFLWVFLALLLLPAGAQPSDRDILQCATSIQVRLRIIRGDTLPEGWPQQVGASVRDQLTGHGLSVVSPDDLKSDQIQRQLTISAVPLPIAPHMDLVAAPCGSQGVRVPHLAVS